MAYDPEYARQYYQKNKNRIKARSRAWYRDNKERGGATRKQYAERNRELMAENSRRWRQNNPEAAAVSGMLVRLRNPESHRSCEAKRRASKLVAFVEHVDGGILYERDNGLCGICGEAVDPHNFHIDHIIPISRGGNHSYENTQVAHPTCNIQKGCD